MASAIEDEVVRYGLLVAAEEAAFAVVHAAHSQFIVEGSDAGIGILTKDGELIVQAAATSILHSGGIVAQTQAILADVPIATMQPGDIYITNDPYRGGVHANDVMLCQPVFVGGEVAYFTASLIHVLDLGGAAHGGINAQALETFEEGLQLPPLHWMHGGVPNEGLRRLIKLNSRSPVETIGDIDALAAGTAVAAQRIDSLVAEHGAAALAAVVQRYLDATEARTRHEIRSIPNGTYRGRAIIDDDGIANDRTYDICVAVAVNDDDIELDFSGTSAQVRASINSSSSQAFDAAIFAVRCFLDKDIPTNSGSYRPVRAHFPRGSLLNPDPPHPCGGRMMAVYALVDAIIEALSHAVPSRQIARSGILQGYAIAGIEGAYWLHNSYDFGGVGARYGQDGVDATGLHFGVGRNQIPQIEPVEQRCRLQVEAVETITDSGGVGEWRGGLGARTVFKVHEDCLVSVRTDRFKSPPNGIAGGGTARPGAFYRITADGTRVDLPSKVANARVSRGERFVVETSGGGGIGNPYRRAIELVADDVRSGKVSAAAADRYYGVVVDATGEVDVAATRTRRAQRTGRTR